VLAFALFQQRVVGYVASLDLPSFISLQVTKAGSLTSLLSSFSHIQRKAVVYSIYAFSSSSLLFLLFSF